MSERNKNIVIVSIMIICTGFVSFTAGRVDGLKTANNILERTIEADDIPTLKLTDIQGRTKDGFVKSVNINFSREISLDALEIAQVRMIVREFFYTIYDEEYNNSKEVDLINRFEDSMKLPILNVEVM